MDCALRVLLVEDDQLALQTLEDALTDGGFATARAISGEEAVRLLEADDPGYGALVTDVDLAPRKLTR